jgi:hypothetical protein
MEDAAGRALPRNGEVVHKRRSLKSGPFKGDSNRQVVGEEIYLFPIWPFYEILSGLSGTPWLGQRPPLDFGDHTARCVARFPALPKSASKSSLAKALFCHQVIYSGLAFCHVAACFLEGKAEIYGPMAALYAVLALKG